jgi:hypothetical protein
MFSCYWDLYLYMVSPIVQSALADMGSAMKDKMLRFWAVEHIAVMILIDSDHNGWKCHGQAGYLLMVKSLRRYSFISPSVWF